MSHWENVRGMIYKTFGNFNKKLTIRAEGDVVDVVDLFQKLEGLEGDVVDVDLCEVEGARTRVKMSKIQGKISV